MAQSREGARESPWLWGTVPLKSHRRLTRPDRRGSSRISACPFHSQNSCVHAAAAAAAGTTRRGAADRWRPARLGGGAEAGWAGSGPVPGPSRRGRLRGRVSGALAPPACRLRELGVVGGWVQTGVSLLQVNFVLFVSIVRILLQKLMSPDVGGSEQSQYK